MISIANVTKMMGGEALFTEASFQINSGEKVGLVGPNGAGKTTFFRMITGDLKPDEGQISTQANTRIAYFSQNVGEMRGRTALEEVMAGSERVSELGALLKGFEEKLCDPDLDPDEMNKILEKMGDAQTEFEKLGGYDLESNAKEILSGLGIEPHDHTKLVQDFSGGWKMRIALAKVLIVMPDLILMDEPTNYLDMETIIWLEKWLINFKGAIFMTSHDRVFMNKVVKKIVEVSQKRVTTYSGNYDYYLQEKEIRRKQNEASFQRQQDMLKKEEEFIARFAARASHAAQVQSRVKKLEKIDRVELDRDEEEMSIMLPNIPRGGNDVVMIKGLAKTYSDSVGNKKEVFRDITCTINRQEKIAVVGVNGAGKSTLMKIIAKAVEPTVGEATVGPSILTGYFSQHTLEVLNAENTIYEELQQKLPTATDGFIRNLLAAFLFRGDEVFKKIRYLSGGEKSRVVLACLLTNHYNLLLLDEPTNHLDIKSREVLLDALKRYEGTIMIVSHDRYFLHHLATKVLQIDKGEAHLYPGNYQEYLEWRGEKN